jgi:hypothetical protein
MQSREKVVDCKESCVDLKIKATLEDELVLFFFTHKAQKHCFSFLADITQTTMLHVFLPRSILV